MVIRADQVDLLVTLLRKAGYEPRVRRKKRDYVKRSPVWEQCKQPVGVGED